MPQNPYPFIDIAVHPAIRGRFAAGEAIVLFARDMSQVLWANGEGARLFGFEHIYDLLDNGPDRGSVSFRQLLATARQLDTVGDRRGLMMRITAGFSSQAISAEVSLVEIRSGETVVILSAPVAANATAKAGITSILKGFDDPDTHMAVIDGEGSVLDASQGFAALGILPETVRMLIAAVAKSNEGLIKRPIASSAGYLPAAVGRLSIDPPLNLIFCVETVLGRMDPPLEQSEPSASPLAAAALPVIAGEQADTVEDDISIPGLADPEDDLPVEGLVETAPDDIETTRNVIEASRNHEQSIEGLAPTAHISGDLYSRSEVVSEVIPLEDAPQNLELAADQAQASTDADTATPDVAPENVLFAVNFELAGDQAEAQAEDAAFSFAEPEDYTEATLEERPESEAQQTDEATRALEPQTETEADMVETSMNEEESTEDLSDLALLDGASSEDLEVQVSEDEENSQAALNEVIDDSGADVVDTTTVPADDAIENTAVAGAESVLADEPAQEVPEQQDGHEELTADTVQATSSSEAKVHVPATSGPVNTGEPQSASDDAPAFAFRQNTRPVRFVWKLDAEGRFSEVSEEFARTVGPHAGDINGMSYRDLDSLFHLDPSREIGALLERRDTWSGRTIRWPVEGTDLVVPVDLAALPTYSRNREFDGFRGFGIIRVADAEKDPHAVGLTLSRHDPYETQPGSVSDVAEETGTDLSSETSDSASQASAPETGAPSIITDEIPLTIDDKFHGNTTKPASITHTVSFSDPETIAAGSGAALDDDFRGEVPALSIEPQSFASFSEKVIQLEERRARNRDSLTTNEQNAFREIARQLEPFGKRPNETLLSQQDEPPEAAPAQTEADLVDQQESPVQVNGNSNAGGATSSKDEASPIDTRDGQGSAEEGGAKPDAEQLEHAANEASHADGVATEAGLTAAGADQIPMAILIHAGDRLIHANTEFRRLMGYESLAALDTAGGLDALITRHEGSDAGVYAIRADGTQLAVSARLQSVRYEGAKLLMLTLAPNEAPPEPRDMLVEDQETARRLASLKVEADELRSILETATDGVVVLDTDGRIRSMNRSASALFNFENSEIEGKPFAMLFAHESQKAVQDYLNGLSGHGVASVLNDGREVIGREASGGFIPMFMTMGRMPGSNSYCAVIRDITQWKRSEEELKTAKRSAETANQHKSDFLARVSHEIRTPLNAIIGFADMIASEHFGPAGHSRYVEYANDIGRSGRHVLDIVNDLLDISKIEAGEMDLEFSAVGINACLSEAVSLVQPQANTQRVIIRTSLSQSVPDVVADVRSIKQIAINILANAIRFTPSGGQIVVSTAYEPNGSVTLRVRDTGIGMSKSELEQAMKPFGQVQPGARKRGDGTGLGLPLTRVMTEANRATFTIQSAPNEGTLVEIVFPPQRVLAD